MRKLLLLPFLFASVSTFNYSFAGNNPQSISKTVIKLAENKSQNPNLHFGVYKYSKGDKSPFVDYRNNFNEAINYEFLFLDQTSENPVNINTNRTGSIIL